MQTLFQSLLVSLLLDFPPALWEDRGKMVRRAQNQGRGSEWAWLAALHWVSHFPVSSKRRTASPVQVNSPTFRDSLGEKNEILFCHCWLVKKVATADGSRDAHLGQNQL